MTRPGTVSRCWLVNIYDTVRVVVAQICCVTQTQTSPLFLPIRYFTVSTLLLRTLSYANLFETPDEETYLNNKFRKYNVPVGVICQIVDLNETLILCYIYHPLKLSYTNSMSSYLSSNQTNCMSFLIFFNVKHTVGLVVFPVKVCFITIKVVKF